MLVDRFFAWLEGYTGPAAYDAGRWLASHPVVALAVLGLIVAVAVRDVRRLKTADGPPALRPR